MVMVMVTSVVVVMAGVIKYIGSKGSTEVCLIKSNLVVENCAFYVVMKSRYFQCNRLNLPSLYRYR